MHSTRTPKGADGKERPEKRPRIQIMYLDHGVKAPIVEITSGQYLWEAFRAIGIGKSGAMGMGPLEWNDIWAFSQATRQVTEPWELELIHEMSQAYFRELERGKNPFAKSPLDKAG